MVLASNTELASLMAELSRPHFKNTLGPADQDPAGLSASIPTVDDSSRKALGLLSHSLSNPEQPVPVLDLLRCYKALRRGLPEPVKAGKLPQVTAALRGVVDRIHDKYDCLSDLIEYSDRPALVSPDTDDTISHAALRASIRNFRLPLAKDGERSPVVAIALPNGPSLAATCMCVAAHYAAAPINAAVGAEQFRSDVEQVRARCILTTPEVAEKLGLSDSWVTEQGIQIFYVTFTPSQTLGLTSQGGEPLPMHEMAAQPNKASDICLMLFTSGTSGTKKIVPLTLHLVVFGAVLVIDSWGLSSSDICLNMMPLFHVGGLLRNIFAPILAGGSTVCCPAFDPGLFWSVVERIGPTWYYASPTMHSLILSSAPAVNNSRFRLICNAAGGLLPSLATQLQEAFKCTVLPSYGMTECMPISTPPLTYKLDRAGTSGIATGPELSILDGHDKPSPPHTVGKICVRGEPVTPGYLQSNGEFDRSAFNDDGWFDTGDMGYLDEEGYLYVTGRSKEVINRGGEIISPFEVENAIVGLAKQPGSPIAGRVTEALSFSVTHDVLQEVVGVVLVTPAEKPRVDLRVLHEALKSSLQQAKWPSVIVYMDGLPKRNNKVLRIRMAERLALPTLTDDTPHLERHWEAVCPPAETSLSEKIVSRKCTVNEDAIAGALERNISQDIGIDVFVRHHNLQGSLEAVAAPRSGTPVSTTSPINLEDVFISGMTSKIHNYAIPHRVHWLPQHLPRLPSYPTVVDVPALDKILREVQQRDMGELLHTTKGRVVAKFAEVLSCDPSVIEPDVDFFSLGGDSLRAGKLVAALRTEFGVTVPINMLFNDGTVNAMTDFIDENASQSSSSEKQPLPGCEETYSSTRWWLLLLQLTPMVLVYPFRRALQWTFFMVALSYTQWWPTNDWLFGRLFNLVVSIVLSQFLLRITLPWAGIAAKWLVIGRHKEGLYPMWGPYHTRWWLVQKVVSICGLGCFGWSNYMRILYYRLMGAKIGRNVSMNKVQLGEWDLVEIGDGAVLDGCTCRPFAAERNTSMYLGRIVIGQNASVGLASIVAPGTEVPENTCIGPNSSSWEPEGASEEHRDLPASKRPETHWALAVFGTLPLYILSWIVSLIPWLGGLVGLVLTAPTKSPNQIFGILDWFADGHRVGFHFLALILRAAFSPFIAFAFAVGVKWILDALFGKLGPSPVQGRSQINTWRMDLMRTLMPTWKLHDMTEMMGQHYEGTSIAVRLLGGKVGRRVYWPGSGPSTEDYHLLNVGDDVVFGSRSHLVTSDGTGADPIVIGNRAMIADRVCLLPGVTVGENTTMGSGAVTRRNHTYAPGATYVGSKGGDAVCLSLAQKPARKPSVQEAITEKWDSWDSSANTSVVELNHDHIQQQGEDAYSPFGRAFYLGQAPYRVLGHFVIISYSSFLTIFTQVYWNLPNITSVQFSNLLFKTDATAFGYGAWWDALVLFGWTTLFVSVLTTMLSVLALLIVIASKWALLGQRQPGNYSWDKSPYCQRWQIFLNIERLRRACFRGHGVLGMLTGTHWVVLYFRALGANIGKDCALFANGDPSLFFTEPDLLTLGDRVAVDDASLVGHLNSRGEFTLNRLEVGDRCVLRTGSRLLSGAKMEEDACLLEHTLIMGGDVVGKGLTMQGWPAGVFNGKRLGK